MGAVGDALTCQVQGNCRGAVLGYSDGANLNAAHGNLQCGQSGYAVATDVQVSQGEGQGAVGIVGISQVSNAHSLLGEVGVNAASLLEVFNEGI